jgi:hypothetical protein
MERYDQKIVKHYKSKDGVWHPIILDPMGDKDLLQTTGIQWFAEQKKEHAMLKNKGERLSY